MNKIIPRWTEPLLEKALSTMPVVVISGARQTGKTTLVKKAKSCLKRKFLSFDDLDVLDQAKRSPDSLLNELPVTIDEVQRYPDFLLSVKKKVDDQRNPGMILLTGSANLALMRGVSESLAGRALYVEQAPFCAAEWFGRTAVFTLIDAFFDKTMPLVARNDAQTSWESSFLSGGYPSVMQLQSPEERSLWHSGYIKTYLERDLRMLGEISSIIDFQRLMRMAALRTARLLNQSELARDAGLSQSTCHRYLNLLETGYQISRMHNLTLNRAKGLVKSAKLMWSDSGICANLAHMYNEEDVRGRADVGFWLEQHVFQTLQAWKASHYNASIHYWHQRPHEVDFVLQKDNRLVAIEIKLSSQIRTDDIKGLQAFQETFKRHFAVTRGIVIYSGKDMKDLGNDMLAVPIQSLT